jgi:hypothetical protein
LGLNITSSKNRVIRIFYPHIVLHIVLHKKQNPLKIKGLMRSGRDLFLINHYFYKTYQNIDYQLISTYFSESYWMILIEYVLHFVLHYSKIIVYFSGIKIIKDGLFPLFHY